jgi:hypothetical protein
MVALLLSTLVLGEKPSVVLNLEQSTAFEALWIEVDVTDSGDTTSTVTEAALRSFNKTGFSFRVSTKHSSFFGEGTSNYRANVKTNAVEFEAEWTDLKEVQPLEDSVVFIFSGKGAASYEMVEVRGVATELQRRSPMKEVRFSLPMKRFASKSWLEQFRTAAATVFPQRKF